MFAEWDRILAHINDVINAAPSGTFGPTIDQGDRGDKRRSQDALDAVAILAAREVIEAVASNPAHSYWGLMRELVPHANDTPIAPHYGEIGIPLIKIKSSGNVYVEGRPKDRDEVEGILYANDPEPTDFYGYPVVSGGGTYDDALVANGRPRPFRFWYATSGGVILHAGVSCKIPMIPKDEDPREEEAFVKENVPNKLVQTVVKRAVAGLTKEGDNLLSLSSWLNQEGRSDLIEIKGGVLSTAPLNLNQVVQLSQRSRV